MAWIKMRDELQTHPKVVRILSATKSDKFRVVGGLHAVWCVFDQHSEDGVLLGYTPDLLDQMVGWTGLSSAMLAVGWLSFDGDQTLSLPEFEEHNGQSAKRRADDSKRKKVARSTGQMSDKCPQEIGQKSALSGEQSKSKSKSKPIEGTNVPSAPNEKITLGEDGWKGIPDVLFTRWLEAYPAVNIRVELAKASAWLIANPSNKKSNYARFLTNWLNRAQDSAPRTGQIQNRSFHDERAATIAGLTDAGEGYGRFDDGRTIDV